MWTIEVDQVSKAFASDRERVVTADGLTLTAAAGEITAVIGESGCGKTTLLRMIAGLETPDSGSIRFTNPEKPDTAPRISVVFQEPRLFPWMTVRENVSLAVRELPGSEKWGRTDEALKAVRLCDAADAFPKELSGGMAQRAGFARAIAQSPDILLLDEAFGALDALTRTVLYQEFQALQSERRMTVLLITHDVLEAVMLSRTILRLRGGVIDESFAVPFPYPRSLATPGAGDLSHRIYGTFFTGEKEEIK